MTSSHLGHRRTSSLPSATTNNLRKRSGMPNQEESLLPQFTYGSTSDDNDDSTEPPPSKDVRHLSWGIFNVAYGAPVRHFSLKGLRESLHDIRGSAPGAGRLLAEIYTTARIPVAVHLLAAMVLIAAPAFSLYLSAAVLGIVEEIVLSRRMTDLQVNLLQGMVFMWLFVAVMATLANRIMTNTAFTLKGHLRAHFLPQLVAVFGWIWPLCKAGKP
ncbi:hypothetical protein DFH07DRAFT_369114 [Mycena maculata]|uniref:Uncharacterized protein n=1 Tax=Mycena maculata TaxID=230809 RepID=A0AAD7H8F0_9AGAR|nr:hypothetical protein DFH07DRAFT_369114 [Mycena maculata]